MGWFKRKEYDYKQGFVTIENKIEEDEDKEKPVLLIHITRIAVYLYTFKQGIPFINDSSTVRFDDLDGNAVEINGTYIHTEMKSINDLDDTIAKFGLNNIKLPIIKIEANGV